jgi:hypothetical protein
MVDKVTAASDRYHESVTANRLRRLFGTPDLDGYEKASLDNVIVVDGNVAAWECLLDHVDGRGGLRSDSLLLHGTPGTGKTYTGTALMHQLGVDVTVIVCPKSTLHNPWTVWLREAFKTRKVAFWSSDSGIALPRSLKGTQYVVCHYEALPNLVSNTASFKGLNVGVILDECHNFNDPDSLRTKSFIQFCKDVEAQNVLWMSGTPVKAMGSEVIPLLRCIDPLFTVDAELRFRQVFGLNSTRALNILSNRMGIVSYTVAKSEVVAGAPIQEVIRIQIPNAERFTLETIAEEMRVYAEKQMAYYQSILPATLKTYGKHLETHAKTLRTDQQRQAFAEYQRTVAILRKHYDLRFFAAEMKLCTTYELTKILPTLTQDDAREFKDIRSIVKYPQLKVRGECLGRVLGRRRIDCHVAMLPYCNLPFYIDGSLKKTLIFTSFVEVVTAAQELLTKAKYKPLLVYGETTKVDQGVAKIVKQFTDSKEYDPLVATYNSLSVGVPVLAANTVLCLNAPWRPHELEQAISRSFRKGQDQQVYVYHFYLDTGQAPNISTRSKDVMKWATEQVDAIMGTSAPTSAGLEDYNDSEDPVALLLQGDDRREPLDPPYFEFPKSTQW